MKVFKCLIFIFLLSFFSFFTVGYAEESGQTFFLHILDGDKVVFSENFILNPEFVTLSKKDFGKVYELKKGYGEKELLNYLFYDMGDKVYALFDEYDKGNILDCVDFDPVNCLFSYFPERSAKKVVRVGLLDEVLSAVQSGKLSYSLRFESVSPRFTKKELVESTLLIGEFETLYSYSDAGRKQNISASCRYLSGAVVLGDSEFSFNERVGERREDRGFVNAKVIVGGELVDGIGGGVCQVATTLYNASLRAGAKILSCTRHSLAPSYVDLSFDSMVSEWSDLRIKNESKSPMFISANCDGERIKVKIFGKSDGYVREFSTVVNEVVRHDEWSEGSVEYKNGYKSQGYMNLYKDGILVERVLLREDYYKPYKIIVRTSQ